jgi:hypothetical protein
MSFLPRRSPSFAKIRLHRNQSSVTNSEIMSVYTHLASSQRPRVPVEPEIVDDSEPERIEIRKTLKKRSRTPVQSPNTIKHLNQIPVIEIPGITSYLASIAG